MENGLFAEEVGSTHQERGSAKLDPAGEYMKRALGETIYSFCKYFLNCN